MDTYGGHHLLHVAQFRRLSVRSGTISFSATTYSYLEVSTPRMLSGTMEKTRFFVNLVCPGKTTKNTYSFARRWPV